MSTKETVDLYRFYDAEGNLLYIGRSVHAPGRLEGHKYTKDWWPSVARMDIEKVPASKASKAEIAAIAKERPIYNIAGTTPKAVSVSLTPKNSSKHSKDYRDRQRGGPPRELQPCGTRSAATRHRRHGEPLCDACREAERAYIREAARRSRDAAINDQ